MAKPLSHAEIQTFGIAALAADHCVERWLVQATEDLRVAYALTLVEAETLALRAAWNTSEEIARIRGVAPGTVESQIARVREKVRASSTSAACRMLFEPRSKQR